MKKIKMFQRWKKLCCCLLVGILMIQPAAGAAAQKEDNTPDKTETVYVNADAEGNAEEITVEAVLKNTGEGETISDVSDLEDIKNTEGDEEYTTENGKLLWQNNGEDIYYKGTSTKELPVSVTVSYFLDGEEMNPEDMAGKSGKVRIRFDYENHISDTVQVDEEEYTVQTPFLVITTAFLSSNIFENIDVTNGKVVSLGDQNIIVGMAFPGLEESLKLGDYEPTEDIEFPEYVELTADVTDFELDFTATVVTTGAFEELNTGDINDAADLSEAMNELQDASGELVDGMGALFEGMETYQGYFSAFAQGTDQLKTGTHTLAQSLKKLNRQKKKLLSGAASLKKGLKAINQQLENVSLPDTDSMDTSSVETAAKALEADADKLAEQIKSIQSAMGEMQDFQEDAKDYVGQVEEKTEAAASALSDIDWTDLETSANEMAKKQVEDALTTALADTALSEEEKTKIKKEVEESIEMTGLTKEAEEKANAAVESLADLPELTIPDLSAYSIDTDEIESTISDMGTQLAVLDTFSKTVAKMSGSLSSLNTTFGTLKTSLATLETGSVSLAKGIRAYNKGIGQIYQGSVTLDAGTEELAEGSRSLNSGFFALAEGMEALKDGMELFDEDGIQSFTTLTGEEYEEVLARLKALKKADKNYDNFSGLEEGRTGSVKFIIETEGIS